MASYKAYDCIGNLGSYQKRWRDLFYFDKFKVNRMVISHFLRVIVLQVFIGQVQKQWTHHRSIPYFGKNSKMCKILRRIFFLSYFIKGMIIKNVYPFEGK